MCVFGGDITTSKAEWQGQSLPCRAAPHCGGLCLGDGTGGAAGVQVLGIGASTAKMPVQMLFT
jgi:hypothetical protein